MTESHPVFNRRRNSRPQRGFTLIELMVTLSVASVLAVVAVPGMQQMLQRRQLEGAAGEITSNLLMARSQAIAKNRNAFVSFSGSGASWSYGVDDAASCDPGVSNDCTVNSAERVYSSNAWKNVSLSQSFAGNSLSFEPRRGTVSGSGTVQLTSAAGEIDVTVSPIGYISACSPGASLGSYSPC